MSTAKPRNPAKKKQPASTVAIFGKVKTQLNTIEESIVAANVVNHILNKRFMSDIQEALEIYADPEDASRILTKLGVGGYAPVEDPSLVRSHV